MPTDFDMKDAKIYIRKKLKWYQWILQKLHLKNYWVELKGVAELKGSDDE